MKASSTLFKSTCDACSKSKTKCDGGNPCLICSGKGLECKYAFRMKRGPKGSEDRSPKKSAKLSPRVMSSYERRLWSVFFTIFKNAKPTSEDSKFVWCWYANQLNKLNDYFQESGNERLIALLDQFYKSLDIEQSELKESLKACPFSPHICGACSSMTILARSHSDAKPVSVIFETSDHSDFEEEIKKNLLPCLVYAAGSEIQSSFKVNQRFVETFAYDADMLNNLLSWSDGGFLPFGGDLMSALFVHEGDVLLYLQIMSYKYQAAQSHEFRQGEHDNSINSKSWEIPSCHAFDCWCLKEDGSMHIRRVVYHFDIYMSKSETGGLSTRMEFIVHHMGEGRLPTEPTLKPVKHDFPLVNSLKSSRRKVPDVLIPEIESGSQDKLERPIEQRNQSRRLPSKSSRENVDNLESGNEQPWQVDGLPHNFSPGYSDWTMFQRQQSSSSSSTADLLKGSTSMEHAIGNEDNLLEELDDPDWLSSITWWALNPDQEDKNPKS